MSIKFWMENEHVSTAKAAGAIPEDMVVDHCPLAVGDTVSFKFNRLAFRVVSRHWSEAHQSGPTWLLKLEPCPHPLD